MDMEKVIKGVHDARRYLEDREWVDKSVGVHIDALNDALAMLKEQDNCENCAIAIEDRQPVVRCKDYNLRNEGVATTFETESDGNTYAYATVDGTKYRHFVWSDPSQAEGLPMANTLENKDRFEKWIKEEWEPIY